MRHARIAIGLIAGVVSVVGCGGEGGYANDPRPPTPINVTAAITPAKVTVSPPQIGAGPVVIIIANETGKAQRVTVETDVLGASSGGIRQSTAPINPQGTATLKLDLRTGRYIVAVADKSIGEARLNVGKPRPSSQDQLLQP